MRMCSFRTTICIYIYPYDACPIASPSSFFSFFFSSAPNIFDPIYPADIPPIAEHISANITFIGLLKAKGANNPGIGDAVPGALFIIPK